MPMFGHIATAEDTHNVHTPAEWEAGAITFGTATGNFTTLTDRSSDAIIAGINVGRWLTRCPYCENAPAAQPDWVLAICYECGSEFIPTFPDAATRTNIEWLLMERPLRNRNWVSSQSVWDLQQENAMADLPYEPLPEAA